MIALKRPSKSLVVTAGLFVAFAFVDSIAPCIFQLFYEYDYRWLFASVMGTCVAQVTLIAAWAVFAPGNIVVRLPWALLFVLWMWYALAAGFMAPQYSRRPANPKDIILLGEILLTSVTVLQIPLWIAKRAFRFRMLRPGETAGTLGEEPFQFQLQQMLLGTFVFALALSPIRFVLPERSVGFVMPTRELFALVPAATIVALAATLPGLWIGFAPRRRFVALALAWILYTLVVTFIEVATLTAILGPPPAGIFAIFCALNFSQCAVVVAVMRIYYALGFRMERLPRRSAIKRAMQSE